MGVIDNRYSPYYRGRRPAAAGGPSKPAKTPRPAPGINVAAPTVVPANPARVPAVNAAALPPDVQLIKVDDGAEGIAKAVRAAVRTLRRNPALRLQFEANDAGQASLLNDAVTASELPRRAVETARIVVKGAGLLDSALLRPAAAPIMFNPAAAPTTPAQMANQPEAKPLKAAAVAAAQEKQLIADDEDEPAADTQ